MATDPKNRDNPDVERVQPRVPGGTEFPEETESEEYKAGGLPDTSKYTVDKKGKSEPKVTTPAKEDAKQTGTGEQNYGF